MVRRHSSRERRDEGEGRIWITRSGRIPGSRPDKRLAETALHAKTKIDPAATEIRGQCSFNEAGATALAVSRLVSANERVAAGREIAKKLGVEIKQTYLTSGQSDLLIIVESASGDNVAKYCMQIGSHGNVRTRTVRAWSEAEYQKLISELS
jgi:uncharacterized protein with GYD domain